MDKISMDVFYISVLVGVVGLLVFAICVALYYKEQLLKEERKLFELQIDAYATDADFIVMAMPKRDRKKTRFKTRRRYNPSPRKLAEDVCLN